MSKKPGRAGSKSEINDHHPNQNSDSNDVTTPIGKRSVNRSHKGFFKKYNSNRFNTLNSSSGMVNNSMNAGHVRSSINQNKIGHKTRHSIELEKQYKLQK